MFLDRRQAGMLLAERIRTLLREETVGLPEDIVVVGLPRGGVPVASEIALALGAPIDVLVSKKIRAPDNPELAIGAVSSTGVVVLDERAARYFGRPQLYQEAQRAQKEHLVRETALQERHWLEAAGESSRPEWKDKLVIVVDDGIATGMTTLAALRSVKGKQARQVWLAAPVAPADTCDALAKECHRLVVLSAPHDFSAVGCHYEDFHQVGEEEVVSALRSARIGLSYNL